MAFYISIDREFANPPPRDRHSRRVENFSNVFRGRAYKKVNGEIQGLFFL